VYIHSTDALNIVQFFAIGKDGRLNDFHPIRQEVMIVSMDGDRSYRQRVIDAYQIFKSSGPFMESMSDMKAKTNHDLTVRKHAFAMSKFVLTRKCNVQCPFCIVPTIPTIDAPIDKVLDAIRVMDRYAEFMTIQGGEPTIYPHLDDVVKLLSSLRKPNGWTMVTNGIKLKDSGYRKHLRSVGVQSVTISWDAFKTWNDKLVKDAVDDFPIVTVGVIYDKSMVGKIIPLLEHLRSLHTNIVIGPYMYNPGGVRWFTAPKDETYAIPREMIPAMKRDMDEMIRRFDEFDLIVSKGILKNMVKYGLDMSWVCSEWNVLDVNNDLRVQFCQDMPASEYTIFDLDTKFDEMKRAHRTATKGCIGCFCTCYADAELAST